MSPLAPAGVAAEFLISEEQNKIVVNRLCHAASALGGESSFPNDAATCCVMNTKGLSDPPAASIKGRLKGTSLKVSVSPAVQSGAKYMKLGCMLSGCIRAIRNSSIGRRSGGG